MSGAMQMVMGSYGPKTLHEAIVSLGLATNLKLCLDAGDAASYPGSGTKWLDTSGNGYDFNFGDGATSTTYPTFNGTAGKVSSGEYFSFDGGDYFSYDSANEAWMETLHNDGAQWSYLAMFYPTAATNYIIATDGSANYGIIAGGAGFVSNRTYLRIDGPSASADQYISSSGTDAFTLNAWNVSGLGVNENGGAGASSYINKNGSATYNGSYSTAASSEVAGAFTIGARASKDGRLASGSRLGCLAIWQGTTLTAANLTSIYNAIKGRFGL